MAKRKKKQIFQKTQEFFSKRPEAWALISLISIIFFGILFEVYSFSGSRKDSLSELDMSQNFIIFEKNTLTSLSNPTNPPLKTVRKLSAIITAYSSTPEQTDDTPFITAAGTFVRDGIVANNYLPFGTRIKIPELYDDKIFVVEDRMSWKKGNYHFDIWFPEYSQALAFGAKRAHIEILER